MTGAIVRSSDQTSDRLQWFYLDRIRACAISWLANTKVYEIVKHGNWTTISGKKKLKNVGVLEELDFIQLLSSYLIKWEL